MSKEMQTVEVTFEGEELAAFTSESGTIYRLFRYDPPKGESGLFVHWQDEDGGWLECGRGGRG